MTDDIDDMRNEFDDFQWAQHAHMWARLADELTDAAAPIYYAAAAQQPVYEKAHEAAYREAVRQYDEAGTGEIVSVRIEAEEPSFLPAFLLYGFAIENLLKGLYVLKNKEAITPDGPAVPKIHDLNKLAQAANFTLSFPQTKLLEKLTTITTWSGRYPVATTRQKHGNTGLNRAGIFDDPVGAGIEAKELIAKLRKIVDPEPRERGVGGAVVVFQSEE